MVRAATAVAPFPAADYVLDRGLNAFIHPNIRGGGMDYSAEAAVGIGLVRDVQTLGWVTDVVVRLIQSPVS